MSTSADLAPAAKSVLDIKPQADAGWSLDAALSTTVLHAAKPTEIKAEDDLVEWSAAESELIQSMMTEADPATIKPVIVERPKPKPVPQSPVIAAEQAEAKARAARLMEARRAELRSTTATAHQPAAPPAGKAVKA